MTELRLAHEPDHALRVWFGDVELTRYVHRPPEPQLESPRPYWHPVHTLGGELVSLYRPHDHVWHKGIAWSLPNISGQNFWGGPTYLRGKGYEQLPNNGAIVHREFGKLAATGDWIGVTERLSWLTQAGETWFDEARGFGITVEAGVWVLTFATRLTNVAGRELVFGSPTTEGRDNAGYGGLFWRGPRSFSGGTVYAPGVAGGDELMGTRGPWLGFTGRQDGSGRSSTLVFVDGPDNPGRPAQWFVRSGMFACVCPAPFFSTETRLPADGTLSLRYAVVVADGDSGLEGVARLAQLGDVVLNTMEDVG
jgi:hypothetical protein